MHFSKELTTMAAPRVALVYEHSFTTAKNHIELSLQRGRVEHGHGTGASLTVFSPRGDVLFERDLVMKPGEPRPVTSTLEGFLIERGCTVVNRQKVLQAIGNSRITKDISATQAIDLGDKLDADAIFIFSTLGGSHVYYGGKDRSWSYFLNRQVVIDGRVVAADDGRTLGTLHLRTSLAREQGVKQLKLVPLKDDRGVDIKGAGEMRKGSDPWLAAAKALNQTLSKQWRK